MVSKARRGIEQRIRRFDDCKDVLGHGDPDIQHEMNEMKVQ